jgi:Uncharacterized protein conserved in bacteria
MRGTATKNRVVLDDPYFVNAFEKEKAYLRRFDVNRLTAGFRRTAGIPTSAATYGGWESSLISGHFVGHYLTALSQAYRESGEEEFLSLANALVDALSEAQLDDGFLFATADCVPARSQFDNVEAGRVDIRTQAWVPWYTMHKLLAGLVSAFELCGVEKALACASRLGDWGYARTSGWSEETRERVLAIEYGGMNDCLYELYTCTRKNEHAIAAHAFDELGLFEAIHRGEDLLDGRHANTTIPKFLGALNRYRAWLEVGEGAFERAGDERDMVFYLETAERFWTMVVGSHSYVTGGNSDDEHFGPAGVLDAERSEVNCETCNTYNMLKLSKSLFEATGEKKYVDFYENVQINAILSSQNPETGMSMYFQPMATGYFKVFSSEFDHFWCCTGTGTENFTKLAEGLYSCDGDALSVNLYISSTFDWSEKQLKIVQESAIPDGESSSFTIRGEGEFELRLRIPDWVAGPAELRLNGESFAAPEIGGYALVGRSWSDGDRIEIRLPMRLTAHSLPDSDEVVAFKYGPVVLSAALGDKDMATTSHGVHVLKPESKGGADERIIIDEGHGPRDRWLGNLGANFKRVGGNLEFQLKDANRELLFSPHYRQYRQRYGIYWRVLDQ